MQTHKRIIVSTFALAGVVGWFVVRSVLDTVWGVARLPIKADWAIEPPDIAGIAAGIAVFVLLFYNQKANTFLDEVVGELSKVTWPPRKETVLSAGVVSVMVAICALILFTFDTLWGSVVKLLYQ